MRLLVTLTCVLALAGACDAAGGAEVDAAAPDAVAPLDVTTDLGAPDASAPDAAPDDADVGEDSGGDVPAEPLVFTVSVTEWVGTGGGSDSAYATAGRAWVAEEMPSAVVATAGDCVFVEPTDPPLCDPPCGAGTVCVADDTCGPSWQALGAGDIVISGLKTACTLVPETQYHYYAPVFDPEPADGDLFDEGDLLTATAPGDDVPAFTVFTHGVARVETSLACPPVYEVGAGLDVTWIPGAQAGDRVAFVIMSGNHGTQFSRVLCETADTGSLHVDATLFESYVADWHPLNSWRLTRSREEGTVLDGVHVTFSASSTAGCMW